MSKHSAGPWRSGRQDTVSYTNAEGEDGGPWKNVYWNHPNPDKHHVTGNPVPMAVARAYGRTEDETLANARLIAAAPELLSAIKDACVAVDELRGYHCLEAAQWRALIDRIKGNDAK